MKIKIKKKPRIFNVNVGNSKIQLNDTASIMLKKNEQVTFKYLGSEYDVAKKDWGYYATPSINKRLKKFRYECALIKNSQNKFFLCFINKDMKKKFMLYLKKDGQKIVCWLNSNNLKLIENLNL